MFLMGVGLKAKPKEEEKNKHKAHKRAPEVREIKALYNFALFHIFLKRGNVFLKSIPYPTNSFYEVTLVSHFFSKINNLNVY